jgi:hypothetical protein
MMYRIVDEAGVESMGQVERQWSPWYEERPTIEARVVTPDGTVHLLDKSAISDAAARVSSADIFSDDRIIRAPLPAVAIGSVVEYVVTTNSNSPLPDAGMTSAFYFGFGAPIQRVRLTIDAPSSIEPRIVNTSGVEPRVAEKDGRRVRVFETGPTKAIEDAEWHLPFELSSFPYVAFSTGKSWQDVATRYGAIVDKQIAGSDLQKAVRNAIGDATDRKEIITRLLAAIQKDIRYAGVEIAEGSIIPRPPKTVLANKYGDCKDKATLLVAMLREAGLTAHVALLNAGDDMDVKQELPGLGGFNHVIVIVDGETPIWVDPTDIYARAGELPLQDQGRMALIAKPETTALVRTPEDPSSVNVYRETRTFTLPEDGKATVVEVSEYRGAAESSLRRDMAARSAKETRENLEGYVKSAYVAKGLAKHTMTDTRDLAKPFRLTLEVNESSSGIVAGGEAAVAVTPAGLLYQFPEALRDWEEPSADDDPKDAAKKRKHDFLFPMPYVREWAYRIVPPPGYVARTLPPSETKKLGTVTYSQELKTAEDEIGRAHV